MKIVCTCDNIMINYAHVYLMLLAIFLVLSYLVHNKDSHHLTCKKSNYEQISSYLLSHVILNNCNEIDKMKISAKTFLPMHTLQ